MTTWKIFTFILHPKYTMIPMGTNTLSVNVMFFTFTDLSIGLGIKDVGQEERSQ